MRARRSVVDHPPGTGKAPGSNPGESIEATEFYEEARMGETGFESRERSVASLAIGFKSRRVHSLPSVALLRQSFVDSPTLAKPAVSLSPGESISERSEEKDELCVHVSEQRERTWARKTTSGSLLESPLKN